MRYKHCIVGSSGNANKIYVYLWSLSCFGVLKSMNQNKSVLGPCTLRNKLHSWSPAWSVIRRFHLPLKLGCYICLLKQTPVSSGVWKIWCDQEVAAALCVFRLCFWNSRKDFPHCSILRTFSLWKKCSKCRICSSVFWKADR